MDKKLGVDFLFEGHHWAIWQSPNKEALAVHFGLLAAAHYELQGLFSGGLAPHPTPPKYLSNIYLILLFNIHFSDNVKQNLILLKFSLIPPFVVEFDWFGNKFEIN